MQLGPEHEPQVTRLFLSLDAASRVFRFGHPASDASVALYSRRALTTAAFMVGVFVDEEIVGVVEVFEAGRDGIAEVAFAVQTRWRRRGLGMMLLASAKQWAEQSGIEKLSMMISRNNWPMRGLADKAGALFNFDLDEISADIPVIAPLAIAA